MMVTIDMVLQQLTESLMLLIVTAGIAGRSAGLCNEMNLQSVLIHVTAPYDLIQPLGAARGLLQSRFHFHIALPMLQKAFYCWCGPLINAHSRLWVLPVFNGADSVIFNTNLVFLSTCNRCLATL